MPTAQSCLACNVKRDNAVMHFRATAGRISKGLCRAMVFLQLMLFRSLPFLALVSWSSHMDLRLWSGEERHEP